MAKNKRHDLEPRINFADPAFAAVAKAYGLEGPLRTSGLEPQLRGLVKTRASQINGCAYCIDMHTKNARAQGDGAADPNCGKRCSGRIVCADEGAVQRSGACEPDTRGGADQRLEPVRDLIPERDWKLSASAGPCYCSNGIKEVLKIVLVKFRNLDVSQFGLQ
jgi:AhpD family alkylhydroperoxidase